MSKQPPSLDPTTIVRSGGADELEPAKVHHGSGVLLRLSKVRIGEHIDYTQFSSSHLLHATLGASASHEGRRRTGSLSEPRGAISFTPGGRERQGSLGSGSILGLEIAMDPAFIEEACEQSLGTAWRGMFSATDAKAFALGDAAAKLLVQPRVNRLSLDWVLHALARHLGRAYGQAERRKDDGWLQPAALVRIADQLRAQPSVSIGLNEMAQSAGLSVSAFVRAFRGSTGVTPAAFAQKLRVDHACELLRSTELPLAEIAARCGFSSAPHLVRTFRAHRGSTPAAWRDCTKSAQTRPQQL